MLIFIKLVLLLSISGAFAQSEPSFYEELASFHSPVVIQGLGKNPKADVFTTIDFDGDLNSYNNWKNLGGSVELQASVYYSVQETLEHYYITYGLFYPRDYSFVCFWKHCHENDFEGLRITVRKEAGHDMGKVVLLETFAHGKVRFDSAPLKDRETRKVVVVIEAQGHGIHSPRKRRPDRKSRTYRSGDYQLKPMLELWDLRFDVGMGRLWKNTFEYQGKRFSHARLPAAFGGKKWGHGLANPPWSWKGSGKAARKGDWFIDPVTSLCEAGKCLDHPATTYLYNPYE